MPRTITVYGTGCPRCDEALAAAREAAAAFGDVTVEKVTDLASMAAAGVFLLPAVALDGTLRAGGRVPRADEVRGWLAEHGGGGRP